MARDDATFVISKRPPAPKEVARIVTVSAAAGGAVGAFIATVAVVAFFHQRAGEAAPPLAVAPPPPPHATVAPLLAPPAAPPPVVTPAATAPVVTRAPALAASTASTASRATGWLSIATSPWSRVYEGDRVLCAATPCARLVMAAGPHDLVLVSTDDQRRSVRVIVDADETRELRVAFR